MSNRPEDLRVVAVSRQPNVRNHETIHADWWGSSVPRSVTYQSAVVDPWYLFQDRVRTGPFGLTRFPSHPFSPVYIFTVQSNLADDVNPRLLSFVRESPPRINRDGNVNQPPPPPRPAAATLSTQEFNAVMKKMKKKMYKQAESSPRLSLSGSFRKKKKSSDNDEADAECSICLEQFVAGEQLLVTPCNHMFHGDCLKPWVQSHGKCPVCRLAFSDRCEQLSLANAYADDVNHTDLLSLIRAMEEAFTWLNLHH